jgi:hypothetical protein
VADLCRQDLAIDPALGHAVQRSWSNVAAAAGHDLCVPAPAGPYVGAAQTIGDRVTARYSGSQVPMTGLHVPVGQTRTIAVSLFSDAPTSGPFAVSAHALGAAPTDVVFTFDRTSGRNGDTVNMTVRVNHDGGDGAGVEPFVVEAQLGDRIGRWYGMIGN